MSLARNTVQALAGDADGALWVGGHGGLDRLEHGSGGFADHPVEEG